MTYITQNISAFPPAPDSENDTPQNFSIKADTLVAHQADTFVGEANTLKSQINTVAGEINTKADEAEASAADSASSALASAGSANFKGVWNSGTSYTVPSSVYLNGLYYNAILGSTNQNPETEFTYWVEQALDLAPAMSYGNVVNTLFEASFINSLAIQRGAGSVTFSRVQANPQSITSRDRYGKLQYHDADEPRFEKDGLLIEGASTNLLIQSNFQSGWTQSATTLTNNVTTSPDGTVNASSMTDDGNAYLTRATPVTAGVTYTISCFVKNSNTNQASIGFVGGGFTVNQYVAFDFATETMSVTDGTPTYDFEKLDNGWYRIWCTATADVTDAGNNIRVYNVGTSAGELMYVFEAQMEALPHPSSQIPTTVSTVTRNADECVVDWINNIPRKDNPQAIICDINTRSITEGARAWYIEGNETFLLQSSGGASWNCSFDGGVSGVTVDSVSDMNRIAFVLDSALTLRGYANGIENAIPKVATFTAPTTTAIRLGSRSATQDNLYGHIKNFKIYDFAPSQIEVKIA